MAGWIKCTTTDGTEIRLNLDHVAMIRPYPDDRGFTGSEKSQQGQTNDRTS